MAKNGPKFFLNDFLVEIGARKYIFKAKLGHKNQKEKKCPKTIFLSRNWGKNGKKHK